VYQNSVDLLQKNFTSNLLFTMTTYSEKPEGSSSQERDDTLSFQNPVVYQ